MYGYIYSDDVRVNTRPQYSHRPQVELKPRLQAELPELPELLIKTNCDNIENKKYFLYLMELKTKTKTQIKDYLSKPTNVLFFLITHHILSSNT